MLASTVEWCVHEHTQTHAKTLKCWLESIFDFLERRVSLESNAQYMMEPGMFLNLTL